MTKPVVTRFAPSPTGFLHIGGARTALFSWLYARGNGGQFLLRIEDTDRARSTQEAIDAILDGLTWLGLDWDGDAVSQFARSDRHREVVDALLASGNAFKCYCSAEEVEALRAEAFEQGRALRSPWRDRDPGEAPEGAPFTVRFRPGDSDVTVRDAVQGDVKWAAKEFDDLILLRSDGVPTYNLAVVVDDHDMGVTHIIRGDDHLTNAARQSQIYAALDWEIPVFAHIPLIHGPDGKKLSKRHGALGVEAYRDMGYLPEGLRAYLLRLGWAHGDKEYFTSEEAKAAFGFDGLNKAPSRLDFDKLAHINGLAMREADDARLTKLVSERIQSGDAAPSLEPGNLQSRLSAAMPALKTRASTLAELADQAYFLYAERPFRIEGKLAKVLDDEARSRLGRLAVVLKAQPAWTEEALAAALKEFAESEGVGFGKVGQPLRAALTGGAPAPDLSAVMVFLGKEEALSRIMEQCPPETAA